MVGSLHDLLDVSSESIAHSTRRTDIAAYLASLRQGLHFVLRRRAMTRPITNNPRAIVDCLKARMAFSRSECVWLFFLDTASRLIIDELHSVGSRTVASIDERRVILRAIEVGATSIIVAHNHPSGSAEPSRADISVTQRLATAARIFDIGIADHIVVSRNGWVSLRERALL